MGTILAWTSPTSQTLGIQKDIPISDLENSLIGGITNVGAMIGAAVGGLYCNFIGRKRGLMAIAIPSIVGWCLIMWGDSVSVKFICYMFYSFVLCNNLMAYLYFRSLLL